MRGGDNSRGGSKGATGRRTSSSSERTAHQSRRLCQGPRSIPSVAPETPRRFKLPPHCGRLLTTVRCWINSLNTQEIEYLNTKQFCSLAKQYLMFSISRRSEAGNLTHRLTAPLGAKSMCGPWSHTPSPQARPVTGSEELLL